MSRSPSPAAAGRACAGLLALAVAGIAPAQAQVAVEARATAPASGWAAPGVGETVTVRVYVGSAAAPAAVRFVGFKLYYRPEAFEQVSRSTGPLLDGLDFDDSDGTSDGFRLVRHDANVYGTGRNAFSFSVALFDGAPMIQADGRLALEAVLRVKAAVAPALYALVPGEVELRDASGALLPFTSGTVRTESVAGGAGVDPPALVFSEGGGLTLDFSALSASATVTLRRSEDLIPDIAFPGEYVGAAPGTWAFGVGAASFATTVCIPLAHVTRTEAPSSVLELLLRTSVGAPWRPQTAYLRPGAANPDRICTDLAEAGELAITLQQSGKLPVELTTFSATADGAGVLLRWTTASETNNAGFAIEQQTGAAAWQSVAFVEGRGTAAAPHAYTHRLAGLAPGAYRFRLRQVDLDGAAHYSSVAEALLTPQGGLWLAPPAPNPARTHATVAYALTAPADVRLALYSLTGQIVAVLAEGPRAAGRYDAPVDVSALAAGVYLVRLTAGAAVQTARLTVLP